ncbi:MAG: hypothetical protein ACLRR3_01290 [Eubacterium sp.]
MDTLKTLFANIPSFKQELSLCARLNFTGFAKLVDALGGITEVDADKFHLATKHDAFIYDEEQR